METSTAEMWVKIYAVLSWIGAFFGIVAGFFMILGGAFVGSMVALPDVPDLAPGLIGGVVIVMGVLMLIFGVLSIFVGTGLWRKRNWARIVAIIFSVFGILQIFSFPVGLIPALIGGLGLYLFAFEPAVKALFGAAPVVAAAPVATTPAPAPAAPAKPARKAAPKKAPKKK